MKKLLFLAVLFLIPIAFAHIPTIGVPSAVPFEVENPEVSQAFYEELEGREEIYMIDSKEPFHLYVQILSPDIKGADKDYVLTIYKDGNTFAYANESEWTLFHEHFANDNYFEGPTYESDVSAGTYTIHISSGDNIGKYVFVAGKQEKFSVADTFSTIINMPRLKRYMEKSPFTAYFNYVGLFLLVIVLLVCLVVFISVRIIKKYT